MSTLLRPDNKQPAEFVEARGNHICLRLLDTVTPAVRWFSAAQIEVVNPLQGCAEPPPMCIYPMPAMYPREVWLGLANGILELAKREVNVRLAVAEGQVGLAA